MVSPPTPLPHPHFIIIGAPKSGTSWLQAALGQHPRIVVVPDEIEYFSSRVRTHDLAWYLDLFDQQLKALGPDKQAPYIIGEKSASYCSITRDKVQYLHSVLPDVRLILMARDPVARHWSQTRRYFSKGRIAEKEGGDVLTVTPERVFDFFKRTEHLGRFATMIDTWTSVFPSEQLIVVSQERTMASPRETYDKVLEHIGLRADYDAAAIPLLFKTRNLGPRTEMPDQFGRFLEDMFGEERRWLEELFGDQAVVVAPARKPRASHPANDQTQAFVDKSVLFTGNFKNISRADAESLVRRLGGHPVGSLEPTLDLVVAGAEPGKKFEKARALGVPVLTEEEFLERAGVRV